jgi:hypothetical protein
VPAVVNPPAVGRPPETGIELVGRLLQSGVEVGRACLRADDRASRDTGDLDPLATVGLARVALVQQLDIDFDDLIVVTLDPSQLIGDVHPEMVRYLDIAALDDDVHA